MSDSKITRRTALKAGTAGLAGAAFAPLSAAAQPAGRARAAGTALEGGVAFVTGAGRGIGRAIAVGLARAGADVACLDICRDIESHPVALARPEDLRETVRLVESEGRRGLYLQADVRDYAALAEAVARAEAELGPLATVVANAGINENVSLIDAPEDEDPWRNVMEVNVMGVANTLRAVVPGMAARGSGSVIATASTFGRQGSAFNPNYAASKWAVVGLVKSAALQAGSSGVRINAVAPTGVVTMLGGPRTEEQRAQGDEFFRNEYHALPVGALQPEDIAGTVVYLASDASRYVTGVTIDVAAGANARYTG